MNIVFLSNYFNHHQRYISDELCVRTESYTFVTTAQMREDRKKLGYGETAIPAYVDKWSENESIIQDKIHQCDAVIFGAAPYRQIRKRVYENKLVFKYSERPLKQKKGSKDIIRYVPRWIKWHSQYPSSKSVYLLCASAYAFSDFNSFGLFGKKAYRWGYFPKANYYDIDTILSQKKQNRILWCGRFLDWKHPDDAICVAQKLKSAGYSFTLDFVGIGEMESQMRELVHKLELKDCVHFLGAMKPDEVRAQMEQSGIFLFTSDRQEGWGAVLNEAMNSGCAVVASHAIGSVPYLVENNINGLIYYSGDTEALCNRIKYLLDNPQEQYRLGESAYRTITEVWNAKVAAERLVNLTKHIIDGEEFPDLYQSGPCSRAEILGDDWFHE